jgi:hypothetical protein
MPFVILAALVVGFVLWKASTGPKLPAPAAPVPAGAGPSPPMGFSAIPDPTDFPSLRDAWAALDARAREWTGYQGAVQEERRGWQLFKQAWEGGRTPPFTDLWGGRKSSPYYPMTLYDAIRGFKFARAMGDPPNRPTEGETVRAYMARVPLPSRGVAVVTGEPTWTWSVKDRFWHNSGGASWASDPPEVSVQRSKDAASSSP